MRSFYTINIIKTQARIIHKIEELIEKSEIELANVFRKLDIIEFNNTKKVLDAFKKYKISEAHLNGTTGYGYGDIGREAIENILDGEINPSPIIDGQMSTCSYCKYKTLCNYTGNFDRNIEKIESIQVLKDKTLKGE